VHASASFIGLMPSRGILRDATHLLFPDEGESMGSSRMCGGGSMIWCAARESSAESAVMLGREAAGVPDMTLTRLHPVAPSACSE
jgi:hypothetical protein